MDLIATSFPPTPTPSRPSLAQSLAWISLFQLVCLSVFCVCLSHRPDMAAMVDWAVKLQTTYSVSLFVSVSVSLSLCLCLSACLPVCLSVCLSVSVSLCLSVSLSLVDFGAASEARRSRPTSDTDLAVTARDVEDPRAARKRKRLPRPPRP